MVLGVSTQGCKFGGPAPFCFIVFENNDQQHGMRIVY